MNVSIHLHESGTEEIFSQFSELKIHCCSLSFLFPFSFLSLSFLFPFNPISIGTSILPKFKSLPKTKLHLLLVIHGYFHTCYSIHMLF